MTIPKKVRIGRGVLLGLAWLYTVIGSFLAISGITLIFQGTGYDETVPIFLVTVVVVGILAWLCFYAARAIKIRKSAGKVIGLVIGVLALLSVIISIGAARGNEGIIVLPAIIQATVGLLLLINLCSAESQRWFEGKVLKCENCGQELSGNEKFCPNCSQPLKS